MKEALSVWLLIMFVIFAMGIAGNLELADRINARNTAIMAATK